VGKTSLTLFAVCALLISVCSQTWATCSGYPSINTVSPERVHLNSTFRIYGQGFGSRTGEAIVMLTYDGRTYELGYQSSSNTLVRIVRLEVPEYWAGKTACLTVRCGSWTSKCYDVHIAEYSGPVTMDPKGVPIEPPIPTD
jgi:hypothetical protein